MYIQGTGTYHTYPHGVFCGWQQPFKLSPPSCISSYLTNFGISWARRGNCMSWLSISVQLQTQGLIIIGKYILYVCTYHTLREEVSVRGSARSSASISVKTNLGFMSCTYVFIIGKNKKKKKKSSCASSSVKRSLQGKKSSRDMVL